MSGPPPQPTSLRALRGNPSKNALNRREPKPGPATGESPDWLDATAREVWTIYAPRLLRLGLLDELSELTFAMACERVALYRRAVETLADGTSLTDSAGTNGATFPRPEIGIAKGALDGARALLAEFGFAPGSRSRIVLGGDGPDDELESFRQSKARRRSA